MADFRWRIYYDDGTTFDDNDGKPQDSPPWGAVVVAQPKAKGQARVLVGRNADYFLYNTKLRRFHQVGETEQEAGVSIGLVDHLAHFAHQISCVRPTRWMADDQAFKAIWKRAIEEAGD